MHRSLFCLLALHLIGNLKIDRVCLRSKTRVANMRIKLFLFLAIGFLCFIILFSNSCLAVSNTWNKEYSYAPDVVGKTLLQISSGSYLVGIQRARLATSIGDTTPDFMLAKIGSDGTLQSSNTYGDSDHYWLRSIIPTSDDGYLLPGTLEVLVNSNTQGNTITNYYQPAVPYVVKIDSSGQVAWNKTFSLHPDSGDHLDGMIPTNDGGYVMIGHEDAPSGLYQLDSNGIWIAKIDSSCAIQWSKMINGTIGSVAAFFFLSADGGYAFIDHTSLVYIDASGNMQWNTTISTAQLGIVDAAIETNDGGYVAECSNALALQNTLIKINSAGGVIWNQTIFSGDESGSVTNSYEGLIQTADNGFVLCGKQYQFVTNSQGGTGLNLGLLTKTDSQGNVLFEQTYGTGTAYDDLQSVVQTNDGGFILLGSDLSASNNNYWLIKTDSEGIAPISQQEQPQTTPTLTLTSTPSVFPNSTSASSPSISPSVPEFPTWIILPLAIATSVLTLKYVKRKRAFEISFSADQL